MNADIRIKYVSGNTEDMLVHLESKLLPAPVITGNTGWLSFIRPDGVCVVLNWSQVESVRMLSAPRDAEQPDLPLVSKHGRR